VHQFQSSSERLSPYRDARTPVMNAVPSVMISARVRVMVAISLGLPIESPGLRISEARHIITTKRGMVN
jgi:hypothetical protein